MFGSTHDVLLVDDDPDVLAVSKLAMRNFTVFGRPLRIHTAASKAEAIELLDTTLRTAQGISRVSVAFIDVVMETDTAGLELCEYIRDTTKNKVTALYVRTGQPGVAPERAVIDRYDINGYFTKVEMTEDKLYTLVKAGIRQNFESSRYDVALTVLDALIQNTGSPDHMSKVLTQAIGTLATDLSGERTDLDPRVAVIMDGRVVASGMETDDDATLARVAELAALPGTPIGPDGDSYVLDGGHLLVSVRPTDSMVEASYLATTATGETPEYLIVPFHRFLHAAAGLWKNALVRAELATV